MITHEGRTFILGPCLPRVLKKLLFHRLTKDYDLIDVAKLKYCVLWHILKLSYMISGEETVLAHFLRLDTVVIWCMRLVLLFRFL